MRSEIVGEGEPEVCVVAGIHGDEPETVRAVDMIEEKHEIKGCFKKVIANEEALLRNKRFIDKDLNRVFPGDRDSDVHEERLAAELLDEIKGMKVINLHSTRAEKTPFTVISGENDYQVELSSFTGVEKVIEMVIMENDIANFVDTVAVEASKNEVGVRELYNAILNFFRAFNVIDGKVSDVDQEFYRVYDTADGSGYSFTAENFRKVGAGRVYAEKDDDKKIAKEDFWPVLASTGGYENMIGFKSKKVDRSV